MKALLLALLLLISFASRSSASCDPTWVQGSWYAGDADSVDVVSYFMGSQFHATMGYDYHQGRLFGHSKACQTFANIRASDAYTIQGAPAGIPIPIHVELRTGVPSSHHCGTSSDCPGIEHVAGNISIYSSEVGDSLYCWCLKGEQSVGIDLVVIPDQEFVVGYYLARGNSNWPYGGTVEATVHFSGIPPGAQLVSCHGVNDAAVATQPTTWGRLKAAYR